MPQQKFILILLVSLVGCPLTKATPPPDPGPPPSAGSPARFCEDRLALSEDGARLVVDVDASGTPGRYAVSVSGDAQPTVEHVFSLGGETIMRVTSRPDGAGRLTEIWQQLEASAPVLTLSTRDSIRFEGSVGGRPLVGFEKGLPLEQLSLVGGAQMPDYKLDPQREESLLVLMRSVAATLDACEVAARGAPFETSRSGLTGGGVPRWTISGTGCIACRAAAIAGGAACVFGASKACTAIAGACGPWYGVCWGACFAIGVAGCVIAQVVATDACWNGGACCPLKCRDSSPPACCEAGDKCLDPGRGLCCPPGTNTCGTTSCCSAGQTCMADGSCCENVACNGQCCGFGEKCTPNGCCKEACGGACCNILQFCGDQSKSLCCSVGASVCNGQCCGAGSACLNGQCCAPERTCGSVCCPEGSQCSNPATGQCSPCPSGQVACQPRDQCTQDAYGPALCCAPGRTCCGSGCCGPGEICFNGSCTNRTNACVR